MVFFLFCFKYVGKRRDFVFIAVAFALTLTGAIIVLTLTIQRINILKSCSI